jgi:hypothetical protein
MRIIVTIIGVGVIAAGAVIGIEIGLRIMGIIKFEKVYRGELTIKETRQQRLTKSKVPLKFNLVHRGEDEFIVVGNIDNTNIDWLILSRTTQFNVYSMELFGVPHRVYRVIPSLVEFYITKVIGSVVAFIIGGTLLGVARDLWLINDIVAGRKKPWLLDIIH